MIERRYPWRIFKEYRNAVIGAAAALVIIAGFTAKSSIERYVNTVYSGYVNLSEQYNILQEKRWRVSYYEDEFESWTDYEDYRNLFHNKQNKAVVVDEYNSQITLIDTSRKTNIGPLARYVSSFEKGRIRKDVILPFEKDSLEKIIITEGNITDIYEREHDKGNINYTHTYKNRGKTKVYRHAHPADMNWKPKTDEERIEDKIFQMGDGLYNHLRRYIIGDMLKTEQEKILEKQD